MVSNVHAARLPVEFDSTDREITWLMAGKSRLKLMANSALSVNSIHDSTEGRRRRTPQACYGNGFG